MRGLGVGCAEGGVERLGLALFHQALAVGRIRDDDAAVGRAVKFPRVRHREGDAVAQYTLHLLQNGVHRLARLAPCSKEIDQNKLATVYYIIECLHNYLSISVKRLKVL